MKTKLLTFWSRAVDLTFDAILGTFWVAVLLTLILTGVPMILLAGIGLFILLGAFALLRLSGYTERHRAMALHDVDIPPPPRKTTRRTDWLRPFAQVLVDITDPVTWRTLAHHVVSLLFGSVFAWLISGSSILVARLTWEASSNSLPVVVPFLVGAAAVAILIGYVIVVGRFDKTVSVALLGPSRAAQLSGRVEHLTEARQGAVSAAGTERRRFERDLHDGVQPRLVSTALTLGMARARFDEDPAAARALLDEAHAEIKESITELRQLARGMHPAVLADRGLDAALSAVASRSPVPVSLEVRVPDRSAPDRLSEEVEAVLYFVVAEALTNVAKHSGATRAQVRIARDGSVVRASVEDDGVGGARITDGGGLSGIQDRVRAAGGTFALSSPEQGPTEIVVEVPCAS